METEIVRRRINKISGHLLAPTATNEDIISSTTHLLPMNCSSSLNSVIRRCDNRMYFARQSSDSQGFFMRQSSSEQGSYNASEAPLYARPCVPQPPKCSGFMNQGSCISSFEEAPLYARPCVPQPLKCSGFMIQGSCNSSFEAPLFSRPAKMEPNFPNYALIQQDCKLSTPEKPLFAKPYRRIIKQGHFSSKNKSKGIEWYPRMNVSELGCNYVMTIEIPGVGINDIRVEVDDQNLTVMAKHSTERWKLAGCSNGSSSAYNRRKYREEPYQVVWPLPTNVNKDTISAEFLNGLLQIIIPKF